MQEVTAACLRKPDCTGFLFQPYGCCQVNQFRNRVTVQQLERQIPAVQLQLCWESAAKCLWRCAMEEQQLLPPLWRPLIKSDAPLLQNTTQSSAWLKNGTINESCTAVQPYAASYVITNLTAAKAAYLPATPSSGGGNTGAIVGGKHTQAA